MLKICAFVKSATLLKIKTFRSIQASGSGNGAPQKISENN